MNSLDLQENTFDGPPASAMSCSLKRSIGMNKKRISLFSMMLLFLCALSAPAAVQGASALTASGETVQAADWLLDPGHGGSDPGAIGPGGRYEKDDVLRLTLRVGELLSLNGETVAFTRVSDKSLSLSERSGMDRNSNFGYFVSIHRNSFSNSSAAGIETYYYSGCSQTSVSAQLAANVQNAMNALGLFKNRGVKTQAYHVLRYTQSPAILTEVGFISNPEDNALFDAEFEQIARAIASGCLAQVGKTLVNHSPITKLNGLNIAFRTEEALAWAASGKYMQDTKITLEQEALKLTAANETNDPYVYFNYAQSPYVDSFNAAHYPYLSVTLKSDLSSHTVAELFLCAGNISAPTGGYSVTFPVKNDGEFHTYYLNLQDCGFWSGAVHGLRLDYFTSQQEIPAGAAMYIKSLCFYQSNPVTYTALTVTPPSVTIYEYGSALRTDGLVVTAHYSDGSAQTVAPDAYRISGFQADKAGQQKITVSYNGKESSFTVTVKPKILTEIRILPPARTAYLAGEAFSTDGMEVIAYYSNQTSEQLLTGYTVSGFTAAPGLHTITVSYNGKSASFQVTVAAVPSASPMIVQSASPAPSAGAGAAIGATGAATTGAQASATASAAAEMPARESIQKISPAMPSSSIRKDTADAPDRSLRKVRITAAVTAMIAVLAAVIVVITIVRRKRK